MRRTIVMLIAVTMIMGIFAPVLGLGNVEAAPTEVIQGNEHATLIVAQWHGIGHDEYGDPLPGGRSLPWQHEGVGLTSYWGRNEYGMPNANIAMSNTGLATRVRQNNYAGTTQPMLWTKVYLTIIADNGQSRPVVDDRGDLKGVGLWYVIMDTAGQVWFDMDGHFHDSRYVATADPFSPYYTYIGGGDRNNPEPYFGSCIVNPLAKVDPAEANNTQGPYHFSEELPGGEPNELYVEPLYFWVRPNMINKVSSLDTNTTCDAYANHTLTGESRVWQLGILSKPDYLGAGIESPLGNISDGVVRSGEWDVGIGVRGFEPNELFADAMSNLDSTSSGPPPAADGTGGVYNTSDPIYKDADNNFWISIGDTRLSDVSVGNPPNVTTYLAGTIVKAGDADLVAIPLQWSLSLYSFPPGYVYAAGMVETELTHRHLGDPVNPAGMNWSDVTPTGTSFIAVDDTEGFVTNMSIRIGPNGSGDTQLCNVVAVVDTTRAATRSYSLGAWNCGGGYDRTWRYYFYATGFNNGDYVTLNNEILRITNIRSRYGYRYPWCSTYYYYISFMFGDDPYFTPSSTFSYNYGIMERIQDGLILDCVLANDFAVGDPVSAVGYSPGAPIYLQQNPGDNAVGEGDIRQSNVDGHRNQDGYIMGQGAWEFDALVMNEVLFADPNDPRYQGSVNSSDWHASSADTLDYAVSGDDGEWNEIDYPYASCMPTYDISIESDFWQGERVWVDDPDNPGSMISVWKGVQPSVTAFALRSPNDDVDDAHHRVAKQTVLGPEPDDFFIHSATIHNVTPDYREYLGYELFVDNDFDNNPVANLPANAPVAYDLHDNYQRGNVCSAYAGATNRAPDLDLNRDLSVLDQSKDYPKFVDLNNSAPLPVPDAIGGWFGDYGCNEPIYFDLDEDHTVSVGDRRATNIDARWGTVTSGGLNSFLAGSIVQPGDSDVGRLLSRFIHSEPNSPTNASYMQPVYKWYDVPHGISRLPSGLYDYGEPIYWDHPESIDPAATTLIDGDNKTNPGDIRLSDVDVASAHYFCGQTMGIGDIFINEFPLHMISMGKNGDYNYIDFPVLPFPTMDVKVEMDMPLKVEQTSNVKISVNPPPKPGESIFVVLKETRIEARQPVEERQLYMMKNVDGNWFECNELDYNGSGNPQQWTATRYYHYYNNVQIGFDFPFFGAEYNEMGIHGAGYFNFSDNYNWSSSRWIYSWWSNYYSVAYLSWTNRPPRVHALGALWRLSVGSDVCFGNAIWPDTGEEVFVVMWSGTNYFGGGDLIAQVVLFQNGQILIQFQDSACPPYGHDGDMEVGITDGQGNSYEWTEGGPCGFGAEANVMFTPLTMPARPGRPALDIAEDSRWLTPDNAEANFEFTPYRGTCLPDGTRQPIEINLYRDVGGIDDPNVIPRNPPPKTYLAYREPSYNIDDPMYNGRVIAVQNTFGYLPGDWVLIGGMRNTERRRITQVHNGTSGAITSMVETSYRSTSSTRRSHILPVKSITDFYVGATVVVGWNTSPTQETHIITHVSRDIAYDGGTNADFVDTRITTTSANRGDLITITVTSTAGFLVGDFIGYGSNNWWDDDPMCSSTRIDDVARIVEIVDGTNLVVNRTHYGSWYNGRYIAHIRGIETRDPLKFQHFDECDATDGRAEQVFTTEFSFTLHRGLNYNHIFGEPVVGIVYFDPYWTDNKWERFDLDMYPTRQFSSVLPPDTVSPDLDNSYDCFWSGRFDIEPEEINIVKARECISVLDQRFPNILLSLFDHDNPNDVNDPADIPISCPAGVTGVDETIIANVNVSGCGIEYLMTAGMASPNRFIIQVNTDGTYWWWRWYEPPAATQIIGALDPNDWLYTWLDNSQAPASALAPATRTPMPTVDNTNELRLIDNDCSIGGGVCDPCNDGSKLPCLGDVTINDAYGRFMDFISDPYSNYPNAAPLPANFGRIEHFGIPCVIDRWELGSDGGQIMFPAKPQEAGILDVRVYTNAAVFDYNSSNIHWPGPYFTPDTSYGIDYCGYTTIRVLEADSDVNFAEFRMVDHGLQNSQLNYTTGNNPIYPMAPPAPRIQASYNPIIYDYNRQVRSYPGGQTHAGRLAGGMGHRWNSYPAIWENQFVKLGTEFYPLTDYGMYFILKNGEGNHIGYARSTTQEPDLALRWMRITGPFMRPRYFDELTLNSILGGSDTPYYEYNNIIGLPISYDYSGQIDVNPSNFSAYCAAFGGDFSQVGGPLSQTDSVAYDNTNTWLSKWKDLYYGGFWSISRTNFNNPVLDPITPCYPYVWAFDELIPTGPGEIKIELELYNDVKKVYEDCCQTGTEGTKEGIPVHGLKIEGAPQFVTVLEDNVFDLTLTEPGGRNMGLNNGEWLNIECNDALLFAWQDRGTIDPNNNYWYGPLDGHITIPPYSSELFKVETQFAKGEDHNSDGFVSFADWETEIVGRYDMATNTWEGGMIDARTFQRENGKYRLELTEEHGAMIDQVGIDIGGRDENGRPLLRNHVDHIVDGTEVCPFNITAYKYGDDNQDRAFTPLYDEQWKTGFSHEVYLAGQVTIGVEPKRDLNVTYSPEPLTAGVIPEKLGEPLTFHVTDYNGDPVDLFEMGIPDAHGGTDIEARNVWYNLFKDPLPDNDYYYGRGSIMPQYYWLRTDLHNLKDEEGSNNYNTAMYNASFLPIEFVYGDSANGNYAFNGFIANDQGEFEVYVYTPDRRHSGVVTVKVILPKVNYEVVNTDAQSTIFDVPSTNEDPDFILTGGDNRTYVITATCRNAQDALLKGTAKGVSVCTGEGEDIARFTVANTLPHNFWWSGYSTDSDGITTSGNYYNFFGVDINDDGSLTAISMDHNEFGEIKPMNLGGEPVFYNTYNMRYTDNSYDTTTYGMGWGTWWPSRQGYTFIEGGRGSTQFMSIPRGWGLGCIYNQPYHHTYLMADLNGDNTLSFKDSLSLNEQGRTTFYFFANDGCTLTGLVGYNDYSNVNQFANVAGAPSYYTNMDPNYSIYRVSRNLPDTIYHLDWEAWADTELTVAAPGVEVINPLTGEEWTKGMLNPDNYDLTYAVKNHMLIRVYPADRRDTPITEHAAILYSSPDHDNNDAAPKFEHMTVGRVVESDIDPNAMETHIYVDPTGTGESVAGLAIRELWTGTFDSMGLPSFSLNTALTVFDVIKGIELIPEIAGAMKVGIESTLTVKVVVAGGAMEPVAGIAVKLDDKDGVVKAQTATTNDKGMVEFKVTPTKPGKIIIRAQSDEYGLAVAGVGVEVEVVPPMLIIDSLPSTTNKGRIKISGKTTVGAAVKVGTEKAKVSDTGIFEHEVSLVNGYNSVEVTASNTAGMSTSLTVGITRDSEAPEIILDQDKAEVFGPNIVLTGKVEPYSKVTVNGQPASVVYDTWRIKLSNIDAGELKVKVVAVDPAGNENEAEFTVTVVTKRIMLLDEGSLNVTIDGNVAGSLARGPYVDAGTYFTPATVLAMFFDETNPTSLDGKLTMTINGKIIEMTVGSKTFTLDGVEMTMTNPPVEKMGIVFIDIIFFAKLFNINADWDHASNKLTLSQLQ